MLNVSNAFLLLLGGGGSVVISCLNLTHSSDICADLTTNPRITSKGPSKSTKYFMEYFM